MCWAADAGTARASITSPAAETYTVLDMSIPHVVGGANIVEYLFANCDALTKTRGNDASTRPRGRAHPEFSVPRSEWMQTRGTGRARREPPDPQSGSWGSAPRISILRSCLPVARDSDRRIDAPRIRTPDGDWACVQDSAGSDPRIA